MALVSLELHQMRSDGKNWDWDVNFNGYSFFSLSLSLSFVNLSMFELC